MIKGSLEGGIGGITKPSGVDRAEREPEAGGGGAGRGCSKTERPESAEWSDEEDGMIEEYTGEKEGIKLEG
jgi:hypothetical protein